MSATADSPNSTATLEWHKPDACHLASTCGRYTVSRVTVTPHVHYIAWLRQPLRELESVKLPAAATDDERKAAIARLQQRCADDAAGVAA